MAFVRILLMNLLFCGPLRVFFGAPAGSTVSPAAVSLSISRPDRTPQKSVARVMGPAVRLITNSPLFLIISWEYRSGRTEI